MSAKRKKAIAIHLDEKLDGESPVKKLKGGIKLVESTNGIECDDFFKRHWNLIEKDELKNRFESSPGRTIIVGCSKTIPDRDMEACLNLIEETSAKDYEKSGMKWSRVKKKKEMALPDMKYIILYETIIGETEKPFVTGFISFMITYEDGHEVIYIYEIHLKSHLLGTGVGKLMMRSVEDIGTNVGVKKAMLTVFKSNTHAVDWYKHQNYEEDEFSPGPRKMRNGTVKSPTYLILSKQIVPVVSRGYAELT